VYRRQPLSRIDPPGKVSKKRKAKDVPYLLDGADAQKGQEKPLSSYKKKKIQKSNGEVEYVTAAQLKERAPSLKQFQAMQEQLNRLQVHYEEDKYDPNSGMNRYGQVANALLEKYEKVKHT